MQINVQNTYKKNVYLSLAYRQRMNVHFFPPMDHEIKSENNNKNAMPAMKHDSNLFFFLYFVIFAINLMQNQQKYKKKMLERQTVKMEIIAKRDCE